MRFALLIMLTALAGCARPGEDVPGFEPIEFEHDHAEGAQGFAPFTLGNASSELVLELWFAPKDATAHTCLPGDPPASVTVFGPASNVPFARLLATPECGEWKSEDDAAFVAGDWSVVFEGRGDVVGRVRLAQRS